MIDLGIVRPGRTIRIPFGSFAAATGAPSAVTDYADADIQVYKDGGTTQRASAAGMTATTTFDSLTGVNLVTIDLADNTTAGFWAAGSEYFVVISDITVDGQTLRFPIGRFVIGYTAALINTTIATLSSQTSFTLTSGPAEDSALLGCVVCIHDVASAVQLGYGVVSAYTGSTKTVTLTAGTTFTAAATDNISIFAPNSDSSGVTTLLSRLSAARAGYLDNLSAGAVALASSLSSAAGDITSILGKFTGMTSLAEWLGLIAGKQTGNTTARTELRATGAGSGTYDETTDSLEGVKDAVVVVADLVDAIWDEPTSGHTTAGTTGKALTDASSAGDLWSTALPGAYGAGTAGKIIGDNINATISSRASQTSVDTVDGIVDAILVDTAEIGTAGAGLTNINLPNQTMDITGNITGNLSGSVGSVTGNVGGDVVGQVGSVGTAGIGAASISAAGLNAIADANLDRNMATGTDSGTNSTSVRTPRQALRALRNKVTVAAGTATVTKEDDTTTSWTAAVNTAAGDPIAGVDPS